MADSDRRDLTRTVRSVVARAGRSRTGRGRPIPPPSKPRTRVLPPVSPELFESADDLADAVIERIQSVGAR